MKMNKLGLLFGLVGVTFGVYAADKNNCKQESKEAAKPECSSLCFAGPELDEDNCLEIVGAALYAQVRADASEVALFNNSVESQPAYPTQATGIEPTEKASWGFKVGLGWKTGQDDWKVAARYTWLRAVSNGNYEQSYGGAFVPTAYANAYVSNSRLGDPATAYSFNNLEAGNYTMISDLNVYLTRPTLYTSKLEVSPYFGIDFAVLRRRNTITFSSPVDGPLGDNGYIRTYDRNFWWGVGPMAGVASAWLVGYDVSVVAETYLALTYGQAESYSDTTSFNPDNSAFNLSGVISNDFYQFSPDLYFQLGLEWGKNFDNDTKAGSLRIAYENDYYFQVNKTIQNDIRYRVAEMGALGYQGLVLQAQLDF